MKGKAIKCLGMALCCVATALTVQGCGKSSNGKIEIEIVQYKPEATYEVLNFLLADENIQKYIDAQMAVPCKNGNFTLASTLDGMKEFIEAGNMTDYQDHYYPSEMSVDALIQTYLIEGNKDNFLSNFDMNWQRYNRDIIRMVQDYKAAK